MRSSAVSDVSHSSNFSFVGYLEVLSQDLKQKMKEGKVQFLSSVYFSLEG